MDNGAWLLGRVDRGVDGACVDGDVRVSGGARVAWGMVVADVGGAREVAGGEGGEGEREA